MDNNRFTEGNKYTEVSYESWGERLRDSIKGIVFGILIFVLASSLIMWNEKRSVDRAKTLAQGRGAVISVSTEMVDEDNDNALIHISGIADTEEVLIDDVFGIYAKALKLKRSVEMYQWRENSETTTRMVNGEEVSETTYSYHKDWSSRIINSSRFNNPSSYRNPTRIPYSENDVKASNVTVGSYRLGKSFINQINNYNSYVPSEDNLKKASETVRRNFIINGNEFYMGNVASPQIGDVRVRFSVVKPTDVSAIGKQNYNLLEPYIMEKGKIELLDYGIQTADHMFTSAEQSNQFLTWVLRVVGFVLVWAAIGRILKPLKVLADIVPVIGVMVGAGVGLVSFVLSMAYSVILTSSSWLLFEPAIGIPILIAGIVILFGGFGVAKKQEKKHPYVPRGMQNK